MRITFRIGRGQQSAVCFNTNLVFTAFQPIETGSVPKTITTDIAPTANDTLSGKTSQPGITGIVRKTRPVLLALNRNTDIVIIAAKRVIITFAVITWAEFLEGS